MWRVRNLQVACRVVAASWLLIAVASCGAIALFHPTNAWVTGTMSAAALLPLGAMVAAKFGSAIRRPARYGFAVCCGGYFLFFSFFAASMFLANLGTSQAIVVFYAKIFPDAKSFPLPPDYGAYGGFGGGFGGAFQVADPTAGPVDPFGIPVNSAAVAPQSPAQQAVDLSRGTNFWLIGQSLWALLLGWIGGALAQFMAWRQTKADAKEKAAAGLAVA